MIDTRKLKVTCIERKYKVQGDKAIYVIKAKREFDEDLTEKLLHEDMELKTFLAEYEIEKVEEKEVHKAETIEIVHTKSKKTEKVIIGTPTPEERISITMQSLPEEFVLDDVVKYYKDRDEKQDIQRLKRLFSYTFHYLKNHEIIKIINPEVNARYRRYCKVEDATEKIKNLHEQQNISLEAMT